MRDVARREPALTVATLTAFATAIIGLLVAFGIDVSQAQQDAILAFIAAAFPLIILLGGTIRQFVSPAHKVDEAYEQGKQAVRMGTSHVESQVRLEGGLHQGNTSYSWSQQPKPKEGIRRQTRPGV